MAHRPMSRLVQFRTRLSPFPILRAWEGRSRTGALVSPPVAPAGDVFALPFSEVGRAEDEELETLRPRLVASPGTRRDAHGIPFLEFDDLVVELHPPAPAHDHVHLLLLRVRVAERKAIAGRDALVAQSGLLELEPLGRHAELQVRRAAEVRADVLQIRPEVPERERHGATLFSQSFLEPRIVAYGGEVVVRASLLAEARKQLDGASQVVERLVAGLAREGRKARVVEVKAGMVRSVLEPRADRLERVGVALLAVGAHRLVVERPRLAPVDRLVRLAGCPAKDEDGSVPGRLPTRLRPNEDECPCGRVDRLAVDLERRVPVEHDVQLFLARPGLIVIADQPAVLARREGIDSERTDPEV